MEILGDDCGNAVFEAGLIAAGKRHVIGICAYAQLTSLRIQSCGDEQQ
jgi:hypothetical protein